MDRFKFQSINLTEGDLDFVISQTAPDSLDKENIKRAIRNDADFRKAVIGDDRVFAGIMADAEILLKISPPLYFEILLRKTLKDLDKAAYTIEKIGGQPVPVFDTKAVVSLLSREIILKDLASMLASFIKTQSYTRRVRVRKGVWRKIRFSDLDIGDLIRMCETVEEKDRFGFYKRIADVCLFIPGVFPEQTYFDYGSSHREETRYRIRARKRGIQEYEETGRKFYKLAAHHESAKLLDLSSAFLILQENIALARKPLNFISQHYLDYRKNQLFEGGN